MGNVHRRGLLGGGFAVPFIPCPYSLFAYGRPRSVLYLPGGKSRRHFGPAPRPRKVSGTRASARSATAKHRPSGPKRRTDYSEAVGILYHATGRTRPGRATAAAMV